MAKIDILVEMVQPGPEPVAFEAHAAAMSSSTDSFRESEKACSYLAGLGLEVTGDTAPLPMFGETPEDYAQLGLEAFRSSTPNADVGSTSLVVPGRIEEGRVKDLESRDNVRVWLNSPLTLYSAGLQADMYGVGFESYHLYDLADSGAGHIDRPPFQPAVSVATIRQLLGVETVWNRGFRGQNVVVGIIDMGIDGYIYPVVGGFAPRDVWPQPGWGPVTSHGSMCAADVLVAAPAARIYDYPFPWGRVRTAGALAAFQAVLNQRRINGTPHLTNNSYGFTGRPPEALEPNHEVWNINHPIHRKVREVVASGAPCFYAAGNCGMPSPSRNCQPSGIGPGFSIHASNSLEEVVTVGAVNYMNNRIGYSSQGPGGFAQEKPDVAAYSHFHGNYGPGRPAGTLHSPFDNGTSAASPVAAGVGALLLSAFPDVGPRELKQALMEGAINIGTPGWDKDTGFGVLNAAASFNLLSGRR